VLFISSHQGVVLAAGEESGCIGGRQIVKIREPIVKFKEPASKRKKKIIVDLGAPETTAEEAAEPIPLSEDALMKGMMMVVKNDRSCDPALEMVSTIHAIFYFVLFRLNLVNDLSVMYETLLLSSVDATRCWVSLVNVLV
jgi:hypothetical protein